MYNKEEYLAHFVSVEELEKSIQHVKESIRALEQPVYDRLHELVDYLRETHGRQDKQYYQIYESHYLFDKEHISIDITIHVPRYCDERITWEVTVDEFCDSDFLPRLRREKLQKEGKLFQ
jgi:hypothetical protein